MVGQLLYSLMPWRMASSSSTLTVLSVRGSTPTALRIWIARPENPHIGKLALPFMKSTRSLVLTRSSMRCWASDMGTPEKWAWGRLFHRAPDPAGTALDAGKVVAALHFGKAVRAEQLAHGRGLVV